MCNQSSKLIYLELLLQLPASSCSTEHSKTVPPNQEMERSSTGVMVLLMRHNLTNAQSALGPLFSKTSSTRRVITPQRAEPVPQGNAEQHQICKPTDLTIS
ncbi:uncharacterized [Tachysurus ichikawai]